jgi:ribosomal protein S21
LVQVVLGEGEAFERMLSRFNKGVERAGILREVRQHTHYMKPSDALRKQRAAAERKRRKRELKMLQQSA